ncbi:MAG: hypothetical protein IBJ04_03935 [Hydrogenophaga sp.]|uniref:hypothetical protein n=1 Tax=Hydrogenophaga sp. TaxID=1904254 RepID=UPI00257F171D|nr:hypothetical protein [Hydrogenophaga sp.]MBL0943472.1 hypothetical protein [Hydrogenophaga sp.]
MNAISLGGTGRTQGQVPATAASFPHHRDGAETAGTAVPQPLAAGDLSGQIERIDQSLRQAGRCAEEAGHTVARLAARLGVLREQQSAARAARGRDKDQRDYLRLQIGLCEQQLSEAERDIVVARASMEAFEAQRHACVAALEQARARARSRESAPAIRPVQPRDAGGGPAAARPHVLRAARARTKAVTEARASDVADKGKDRMDPVSPTPVMPVDAPRDEVRFMAATALGALALGLIGVLVDRSVGLKIGEAHSIAPTFAHLGAMGSLSALVARGERLDTPLRVTVLALMVGLTALLIAQGLQSASDAAGAGQSRPSPL